MFGYSSRHYHSESRPAGRAFLAAAPVFLAVIVLLGGGGPIWVQGFVCSVIGILLCVFPPALGLGKKEDLLALAIALLPLLGLLPAKILPVGGWREEAIQVYQLSLPYTIAPNIETLFEWFFWGLCGWGAFFLWVNINPDRSERRFLLHEWVWLSVFLAIGILLGNANQLKYFYAPNATVFSYFVSRNETANVLFVSGILAFGLALKMGLRRKFVWAISLCLAVIILFLATLETTSRAGMSLFVLGCFILVISEIKQWTLSLVVKVFFPLFVISISTLLLVGTTLKRLFQFFSEGDARLGIYQDTLSLIGDHFLTGVGLGNFENIITFYRKASVMSQRPLHPESDFLWWTAEIGVPAIVLIGFWFYFLAKRIFPLKIEDYISTRIVPAVALSMYILHACVDVPMHFFGTLFPAVFLYGLAQKPTIAKCKIPQWFFRVVGGLLLSMGMVWFWGGLLNKPWHSWIRQKQSTDALIKAFNENDNIKIQSALSRALVVDPFDWWVYYQDANFNLIYFQRFDRADLNFRRAMFLEQMSSLVPFYIGLSWLPYIPQKTYQYWQEVLKRQSDNPAGVYEHMRVSSISNPAFKPYLIELSKEDPVLRVLVLKTMDPDFFKEEIMGELQKNPALEYFELKDRQLLFEKWAKIDPTAFLSYIENSKLPLASFLFAADAYAYASLGNWEKATEIVHDKAPKPKMLQSVDNQKIDELEHLFQLNPRDIWIGQKVLSLQIDLGDWDGAQKTLSVMAQDKPVPPYVFFWQGELAFRKGDFKESWAFWEKYLDTLDKASMSPQGALQSFGVGQAAAVDKNQIIGPLEENFKAF